MSKNSMGIGNAHPKAVAATNIAGTIDHDNVKLTLGKPPLPKKAFTSAPEIHSGMNAKSRKDGTHFAGLSGQDLSHYDSNPGDDPLAGPPRGKRLSAVMASPGMKDQSATPFADDISRAAAAKKILDEAADNSAPDDRRALGIGTLPGLVQED